MAEAKAISTTLIADDQRLVRVKDGASGDTYSFHQLEPRRFLVEAWMKSSGRFTYGVLDIQNGEGLLHHLLCENVDEAAFKAAGGIVTGINFKECNLDKVSNALALVKSMAAKPDRVATAIRTGAMKEARRPISPQSRVAFGAC